MTPAAQETSPVAPVNAAFTAAQYAEALGKSKRAVQLALDSIPATTTIPARGQPAKAWAIAALPPRLRSDLAAIAKTRGYRDSLAMMQAGPTRLWQPPVPLNRLQPRFLDEAHQRREVFAPALDRQHTTPSGELIAQGVIDYQRIVGHPISERHWRRLFDRAVQRDGGRQDWQNLALYVDESAFQAPPSPAAVAHVPSLKEPLDEILAEVVDKAKPTADDRAWLYHRTFLIYESLLADRARKFKSSELKRAIAAEWLARLPALAKTEKSLVRVFEIKLARWQGNGRTVECLLDQRPMKSGQPSYFCEPCFELVNHQARNIHRHDSKGNTSEAFRLLWNEGRFCPTCVNRFSYDMRKNKSYVPRCFRKGAAPNAIELAKDTGPKALRSSGPFIPGDHSAEYAGRAFTFDDETPNHIVYTRVDGELIIGVPQNIEGIDCETEYPLGMNIYIGAPSCLEIMKAFYGVFTTVGLPDEDLLLESGVFAARDIIGDREEERPWRDFAAGLNDGYGLQLKERCGVGDAGVQLKRATTPSAKPIEGYFGRLQRRASLLPGFRGFRARDEAPEWLDDFVARCKAGKEDPASELLSLDEFRANYKAIREEFMRTPQNGSRHRGATPLELWMERQNRKPIRQLDPNLAHLISTHRRIRPLTQHGVSVKLSRYETAYYYNGELGDWWGKGIHEVMVYRSIFDPGHITVRDRKGLLLSVPRQLVPRSNATKEQMANINKHRKDFIAAATSRFTKLTHPLVNTIIRHTDAATPDQLVGQFHAQATAEHRAEESTDAREISALRRRAEKLGVSLGPVDLADSRTRRGIERQLRAAELRQDETPADEQP